MKIWLVVVFILFSFVSSAEHQHHNYVGYHGMALFSIDEQVMAYHLPLYVKPHDYQLLYKIELKEPAKQQINNKKLITILPDKFDLQRLIDGETMVINSKVYDGHFERGGKLVLNTEIKFQSLLYKRKVGASFVQEVFDTVTLSNNKQLQIHRINSQPSFDLIVSTLWKNRSGSVVCRQLREQVIDPKRILQLQKNCIGGEIIYLEYLDFQ